MNEQSLEQLRQTAAGLSNLEAKQKELNRQRGICQRQVYEQEQTLLKEQADLEKLGEKSLSNYFLAVIGKLDQRMDRERQEAYAAKVKLDTAAMELAEVERDLLQVERELYEARVAQMRYQEGLEEKRRALRISSGADGELLLELEQKIADLQARKREIAEAFSAGRSARITADRILDKLERADGWNTWDMLGGDGLLTHIAKYSNLDEAQDLVSKLQSDLRRFRTELADIQISSEAQVNVETLLRFADYFFDGLFADWAVGSRITRSAESVRKTKRQIEQTIGQLERLDAVTADAIARHSQELEELIVKASF